jgi:nucleoside-diphosphate-sugar epimerase
VWRQSDLTDASTARGLIAEVRPDVVIHLAGLVAGSRDRALVLPMLEANLLATVALLDAAAEHGCARFVAAGSLEEPSSLDQAPSSPYAASKAAATGYVELFAAHYGLSAVVARLFMVYGPGEQDPNKLIAYVIARGLVPAPMLLSTGLRPVDWVYVDDVVDGLVRLAIRRDLVGASVDLGSGDLVPVRDVVAKLWRLLELDGTPPFGTLPERAHEAVRAADVATTERVLSWRPRVALDEGLARTVAWFRANPPR